LVGVLFVFVQDLFINYDRKNPMDVLPVFTQDLFINYERKNPMEFYH
jgi:hypothetical protein